MWIIARPNGAGKSTFAGPYLDDLHAAFPQETGPDGLIKLNADERMLGLRRQFPDAAQAVLNRRAAEQIDAEVVRLIAEGRSFAVETVLSTPKYRDDVEAARAKGIPHRTHLCVHSPARTRAEARERARSFGRSRCRSRKRHPALSSLA
jgi:predicted ABC-type ATPase